MENITLSVESILYDAIGSLSYTPLRSAGVENDATFSQLPAAKINPSHIVSMEGDERCRATLECEVVVVNSCLSQSPEAISELYATIRHDFASLPSLLKADGRVVDISSFAISLCDNTKRPRMQVRALVELSMTVDFVGGSSQNQLL